MGRSVKSPDETNWEESWKYDAQRSIFDEVELSVSSGDETLCRMLKMSIFTNYFQKLIKPEFPLHILYELLMTLRRFKPCLHGVGDPGLVG